MPACTRFLVPGITHTSQATLQYFFNACRVIENAPLDRLYTGQTVRVRRTCLSPMYPPEDGTPTQHSRTSQSPRPAIKLDEL